jgi:hypothetical protein
LGKNPGNLKKPMGMGKTGFYREKWEKWEKLKKNGKNCLKKWSKVIITSYPLQSINMFSVNF